MKYTTLIITIIAASAVTVQANFRAAVTATNMGIDHPKIVDDLKKRTPFLDILDDKDGEDGPNLRIRAVAANTGMDNSKVVSDFKKRTLLPKSLGYGDDDEGDDAGDALAGPVRRSWKDVGGDSRVNDLKKRTPLPDVWFDIHGNGKGGDGTLLKTRRTAGATHMEMDDSKRKVNDFKKRTPLPDVWFDTHGNGEGGSGPYLKKRTPLPDVWFDTPANGKGSDGTLLKTRRTAGVTNMGMDDTKKVNDLKKQTPLPDDV